jgi:hypothetical protein
MSRVSAIVAALLVLGACARNDAEPRWGGTVETLNGRTTVHNPSEGLWGAGQEGQLLEDLRIGALDGTGPEVWGNVTAIAISPNGPIAVLDGQAQEVRVFDRDGQFLRTVGRKGEGPGEFQQAVAVHFDTDDRLWVVDIANARYEVFDNTRAHVRSTARRGGVMMGDPGMMTRVGLLDPMPQFTPDGEIRAYYVVVDSAGLVADSLPAIHMGLMSELQGVPASLTPYMVRPIATATPSGDIWLASTNRYVLFRRAASGDTTLVTELEVPQAKWAETERETLDTILANPRWSVDATALGIGPQYLRSLAVDEDGRLLVRSSLTAGVGTGFEMFDAEGRFLGRVRADVTFESRPKVLFQGGAVYGVVADDLGVPFVVRARLQLPTGLP